nr:unnamed protein product [Spirometra erinaceieuropaei]
MNWVQARRLGLLSGFAVGILLLLRGFTLQNGFVGGGRQSTEPGKTQSGTVLPHTDTSAERIICSSTPPYNMAFCLADNDTLQTPPLAELPCRWEEDLVANGAHRCLSFASLAHDQSGLKSRTAFQLYPQDLPAQEVVRRARRGLPIGVIDAKLVKEMSPERLPADFRTILASGSQDLTVSRLAEMADRMIEVQRFQPPSVAQTSTSSSTVNEQLVKQMSAMADEMAPPKLQLVRQTSSRSPVVVVVLARDFGLTAFVGIRPVSVQSRNRKTSQPENRRNRFLGLFWVWSHLLCLGQCDSQTFLCGHLSTKPTVVSSALVFISKLLTVPPFPLLAVCSSP